MSQTNRRSVLKSGLLSPLLFLPQYSVVSSSNKVQRIADYIEKEFVKALHAKNEVIESFRNCKVFNDYTVDKHSLGARTGFYGWRSIKLKDLENKSNSQDFGYALEINEPLTKKEIKAILCELWKRAGNKGTYDWEV